MRKGGKFMDKIPENMTDIRDGLSVTVRKILSTMDELLPYYKPHRKFLKVIRLLEEEDSIDPNESYEMIVDMVNKKGYMYLINGHGVFGYSPSDPNYSECKGSEILHYISDRAPLSDTSKPVDIPLPYILIGGTPGYRSMQTKIPPHNFDSVMKAVFHLIKKTNATNEELAQIINGPELYIGGQIINIDELPEIYERGFGEIKFSVSEETLNADCWEGINICKNYSRWYGHKLKKQNGIYNITITYNALLTNGVV